MLDPTAKATFGCDCDGTTSTLSGSYHDPQGMRDPTGQVISVDFKGAGPLQSSPPPPDAPNVQGGCLAGEPPYVSQNPKVPGSGLVFVLFRDLNDNGQADTADFVFLTVDTGPYTGYRNLGNPQGNLTVTQ